MKVFMIFLTFILIAVTFLLRYFPVFQEHSIIINPIIFVLLLVFSVFGAMIGHINLKREKEITQRGNLVQGRIEEIKLYFGHSALLRNHSVRPVVSFAWDRSFLRLEIMNGVPAKKYEVGDVVELLYLPEYPQKVVQKGERPTTVFSVWFVTVLTITASIWGLIMTVNELLAWLAGQ